VEEFFWTGRGIFFGPEEGYFLDIFLNIAKGRETSALALYCLTALFFCFVHFASSRRIVQAWSDGGFGKTQKHTLLF
jgi:hypothetical protein